MRIPTLATVAAASAVILLAGCSGNGSSIAPTPGSGGMHASRVNHSTSLLPPALQSRFGMPRQSSPNASFNTCPATGNLIYSSDAANGVVNIYDSSLNLCGQLSGFLEPQGLGVHNHNIYIANTLGVGGGTNGDIVAYHRGATTPFKTFTDPTGQYPVDVDVQKDGTVIASNIFSPNTGVGSISTFLKSGRYVGTFAPSTMALSYFVVVMDDQTVYMDGFDNTSFLPAIFTATCPLGACTGLSEVGEAMSFPGGLAESRSGDLVAFDQSFGANRVDTFELPNLTPVSKPIGNTSSDNVDMAQTEHIGILNQIYSGDAGNNTVNCFNYKQSGAVPSTCGSVAGNANGQMLGAAVDEHI